jgi:hypothetical protein
MGTNEQGIPAAIAAPQGGVTDDGVPKLLEAPGAAPDLKLPGVIRPDDINPAQQNVDPNLMATDTPPPQQQEALPTTPAEKPQIVGDTMMGGNQQVTPLGQRHGRTPARSTPQNEAINSEIERAIAFNGGQTLTREEFVKWLESSRPDLVQYFIDSQTTGAQAIRNLAQKQGSYRPGSAAGTRSP